MSLKHCRFPHFVLVFFLVPMPVISEQRDLVVTWDHKNRMFHTRVEKISANSEVSDAVAWGSFTNSINETG